MSLCSQVFASPLDEHSADSNTLLTSYLKHGGPPSFVLEPGRLNLNSHQTSAFLLRQLAPIQSWHIAPCGGGCGGGGHGGGGGGGSGGGGSRSCCSSGNAHPASGSLCFCLLRQHHSLLLTHLTLFQFRVKWPTVDRFAAAAAGTGSTRASFARRHPRDVAFAGF